MILYTKVVLTSANLDISLIFSSIINSIEFRFDHIMLRYVTNSCTHKYAVVHVNTFFKPSLKAFRVF